MSVERSSPTPGHEPAAAGFAELLGRIDPDAGDQDLLLGQDVVLRWRRGRVAVLEPPFDAVARLLGAGVAPDALAAVLGGRPDGLDGLALLAWLADAGTIDEDRVRSTAAELTIDTAAELLTLPPERLGASWAPGDPARPPAAADVAVEPARLLDLAAGRHEELAGLAGSVHGPAAVPSLTGTGQGRTTLLDAAVVARIDGRRTVAELAAACGRTRFELAGTLAALAAAGLVRLTPGPTPWPSPLPVSQPADALAAPGDGTPAPAGDDAGPFTPGPGGAGADTGADTGVRVVADVGAAWLALREVAAGEAPVPPRPAEAEAEAAQPEPDPDPEPDDEEAPDHDVMPSPAAGDVDSSSLLRELASINLGGEAEEPDGEDAVPRRPAAGARGTAERDERAKGGRFGFRRGPRR